MATGKGEILEEQVRELFSQSGFFAIRSVPFRAYGSDITDIDVWIYNRNGGISTSAVIDVKSKRSPKAFERVLWISGIRKAVRAEQAMIATTDQSEVVSRFATDNDVGVLTKSSLFALRTPQSDRISLEEFYTGVRQYSYQKIDGDWLERLSDAKSTLISGSGFPAFNRVMGHLRFFSEKIFTKPQQREILTRCMLFTASISCITLDQALDNLQFTDTNSRESAIRTGIIYGESGSNRTRSTINRVMNLISSSIDQGDVVRRRIEESIEKQFSSIRADVIFEYFSTLERASDLVSAARALEEQAFSVDINPAKLPVAARGALAVFADYFSIPRSHLLQPLDNPAPHEEPRLL